MSVQTQINRINAEVSDQSSLLDQALNDLNTEVNSQSSLLEQAIAALQGKAAGGGNGLPTGVSALATGTLTPSSDISAAYTITHDLGVVPNFAFLMLCDDAGTTALISNRLYHAQYYKKIINASGQSYGMRGYLIYTSSAGVVTGTTTNATSNSTTGAATTSTVTFVANSAGLLKGDFTYRWVCGVADDIR